MHPVQPVLLCLPPRHHPALCLTEEEAKNAPAQAKIVDIKAGKDSVYKFAIAISPLDCMGCSVCVSTCPVKALTMKPQESQLPSQESLTTWWPRWPQGRRGGHQYRQGQPVQAALPGVLRLLRRCAETAYARLVTQSARPS